MVEILEPLTRASTPEGRDTGADFNIGTALEATDAFRGARIYGVYVAMNGMVFKWKNR